MSPLPDDLDPGIVKLVRALREAGFETTDSGDGVSKGADGAPYAHVAYVDDNPSMERVVHRAAAAARIAQTLTGVHWKAHVSIEVWASDRVSHPVVVMLVDAAQFAQAPA